MKKVVLGVLILLMLQTALVFASGDKEGAKKSGPVEIEFMAQWPISEDEQGLIRAIEEKINVKVNYTVIANPQQRETIAARLASGDLPDLFFIEDVQAYSDAQAGNLAANISEIAKRLNLTNILDEIRVIEQDYGKLFTEKDGNYYRLPARRQKAYGWYWVYRQDWAEQAGVSYDPDYTKFEDFALALVKNHPEAIGFTGYGSWAPVTALTTMFTGKMATEWSRPNLELDENGKWYAIETTDGYREALRYLHGLYASGAMDQEIFSMNRDLATQKFIQGKAGILIANSPFADSLTQAFIGTNPTGKLDSFAYAPKGPKGSARGGSTGYYKSWVISSKSSEKAEAALRFLNELKSAETQQLALRPELWTLAGGGQGNHTFTEWTGKIEPSWDNVDQVMAKGLKYADSEVKVQNPLYMEYTTELSSQYKPEVASVIEEYSNNYIAGILDINSDAIWNEYLKAVDKAGLPILIEDITTFYK
jgi:putative aldouronate transport system substrate-binding protein